MRLTSVREDGRDDAERDDEQRETYAQNRPVDIDARSKVGTDRSNERQRRYGNRHAHRE